MWLWILSALFIALVWAVWFILRPVGPTPSPELFPTWVAITITAVVVLILVGLVVYRRIRAARAARALEKAIAQQAQEQVLAAKPEDRPEIQELQRQMLEGIKALKASRLGTSGTNALYSLPWYAIVGPPGAGKTTALRHSGLSFPFLDPTGGGVKGVGGTRNCEWWFTNDAILLDTAGRYTMEQADHDEWMAFLDILRGYRPEKPLNGIVVAVSVSDLIDASEEEIQQVGERIRERIDEMQDVLQMVLPVYVTFTKTDLIAGFVEYFADLRRSDRGQPWGSTFALSADKSDPGGLFDREFDLLVEKLYERTIRRMGADRGSRREREKIYQFPLEFAAIKGNLARFMGAAFRLAAPATGKRKKPPTPNPILRGFYFTSGTQEGKPLDRVVGAMGRAFGLRPADKEEAAAVEPKSFFLKDVFTNIIFPDQDIAGRTEWALSRRRLQRMAAAAMAAVVALILMVPAILSFIKNRELVAETRRVSDEAGEINWVDGQPATAKVDRLDRLRQHLELLDQYKEDGAPIGYRWGMYQGNKLFDPTLQQYIASLKRGFIDPVKARLETQLKAATGAKYLEEYNDLKTYLLLDNRLPPSGNREHLSQEQMDQWQTFRLTQVWADILRPTTQLPERDLRDKLSPHTTYYVGLLKRGVVAGPEIDQNLVQQVRDILRRVGPSQRYYDQFVTVLIDQKIDEAGGDTRDNLLYPQITLKDMFADRPDVLAKVTSKRKNREGKWQEVQGPYTARGRETVLASLENGYELLEREKWVVPLSTEEKQQGDRIKKELLRVRQDYDDRYVAQWTEFFRDIDVLVPQNNLEAIEEFRVLATPDWPYGRLLRALKDNTQFAKPKDAAAEAAASGGVVDQLKKRAQNALSRKAGMDVSRLGLGRGPNGEPIDPVPEKFKSMSDFGFPPSPKEGEPPPPAKLGEYVKALEALAGEMTIIEEGSGNSDTKNATALFAKTVADTEGMLLALDRTGQQLMRDLLMNPLRQSYKAMVQSAGGAASGLWEVMVWPTYRDSIRNRYPFNLAAKRDASFDDAVAFFKPTDGILWGFYGGYLKDYHRKVKHQFVPAFALGGTPRPAKPFTPFNANLYNCLERSDEITDAIFGGGAVPKVVFQINLKTVSPIVSEVTFEIDKQKRLYRNEKEFWKTFEWPGPEGPSGAALTVRGAGGLSEEIRREGPWGIFRLFEAGTTSASKDNDEMFTVEWQMAAPPVTVTMQVKPQRANHPFAPSFFRALNCPESIGDRFGPPPGG